MWKTLSGKPIDDIAAFVADAARDGHEVHVGTDSLQTSRFTQFVTVACIHKPPKGGRVAYTEDRVPRIKSLRERLFKEVWKSIELALQLEDHVRGEMTVHIDANPVEQHASSKYVHELVSCVMAQGLGARAKPFAWAASRAADHAVRVVGGKKRRQVA